MDIFDILVICMGLYVIWAAWQLKKEGKISKQVMRSPNKEAKDIRDPEGFQKYVFPRCMFTGVLVTVVGVFGLVSEYAPAFADNAVGSWIETVLIIAVIAVLIWYVHVIHTAEKRFY